MNLDTHLATCTKCAKLQQGSYPRLCPKGAHVLAQEIKAGASWESLK